MAGYATIDNVAVKQIASNIIRENVVQDVIVIPQKAADFRYAEDLDGENITVQRTKMGSQSGRIIQNGLNNGGFLNSKKNNIESDLATIPLTLVYDAPTDVPQNALNLNGSGRLLESILMNTTKAISRFINLGYLSSVIADALNAGISATSAGGSVTYAFSDKQVTKRADDTTAAAMDAFYKAAANLGEGDIDNGYDIFPTSDTEVIIRPSFQYKLMNNAGIFAGNFIGQQMIASGSFDAFDTTYTGFRVPWL